MEKNNKEKSFTFYLDEIKRKLEYLEKYPENNVSETATLLKNDIDEIDKGFRGIKSTIIFTSLLALISISFTIFLLSNNKISRNILNGGLENTRDSILGTTNEANHIEYRRSNGKITTYSQLVKTNDSLYLAISNKNIDLDLCNSRLSSAKDDLSIYKLKLNNKINTENEIRSRFTEKFNKQIDSSFILLDIFRGRMTYDKKKKQWTVSYQ